MYNPYGMPAYQSPYQQQSYQQNYNYQQPQQQIQQPTDDRIFVASSAAAESYLMAPNSFVRLWDSSKPIFYERRTDSSGRPFPMDTYRYEKCTETQPEETNFESRLKALEEKVSLFEEKKKSKKEAVKDEQLAY